MAKLSEKMSARAELANRGVIHHADSAQVRAELSARGWGDGVWPEHRDNTKYSESNLVVIGEVKAEEFRVTAPSVHYDWKTGLWRTTVGEYLIRISAEKPDGY